MQKGEYEYQREMMSNLPIAGEIKFDAGRLIGLKNGRKAKIPLGNFCLPEAGLWAPHMRPVFQLEGERIPLTGDFPFPLWEAESCFMGQSGPLEGKIVVTFSLTAKLCSLASNFLFQKNGGVTVSLPLSGVGLRVEAPDWCTRKIVWLVNGEELNQELTLPTSKLQVTGPTIMKRWYQREPKGFAEAEKEFISLFGALAPLHSLQRCGGCKGFGWTELRPRTTVEKRFHYSWSEGDNSGPCPGYTCSPAQGWQYETTVRPQFFCQNCRWDDVGKKSY